MKTHLDKSDIEARIKDVSYSRGARTITHCYITMANDFVVTGESACVDTEKFDEAVGRRYAYEDAFEKLWELEGYLLAERLRLQARGDENHDIGWAVRQMKLGKAVCRRGWNGRGMCAYFVPSAVYDAQTDFARQYFGEKVPYHAYFALKGVDGCVSTWAPSASDTYAQDWEVFE